MSTEEFLRRLPLFSGLGEEDVCRLVRISKKVVLRPGEVLMEEGSPGECVYVIESGEVEITKRGSGGEVPIARRGPGEPLGEISLLEDSARSATVRGVAPETVLIEIARDDFKALLASNPTITLEILRTVGSRLRTTEAMLRQQERMASLGTLSAGLAHELNNPAAAISRSAVRLREAVARFEREAAALQGICSSEARRAAAETLRRASSPCPPGPLLDPLVRADRTAAVQDWLEARGVEEAWDLAPQLVDGGWDVEGLERVAGGYPGADGGVVIRWIAARCAVEALLAEVSEAGGRISEIVAAVKSYSYLDQAPVKEVDVREGLESTLVILRHRLKQAVTVRREYEGGLPRIEAWAGELNQVFTNLVANAVDAMDAKGTIVLRARREGDGIAVEVEDDGPGIPEGVLPRIFDPFFTTKPQGVGTGLGLHISYNIVRKHGGRIEVESRPGRTVFRIVLPSRPAKTG